MFFLDLSEIKIRILYKNLYVIVYKNIGYLGGEMFLVCEGYRVFYCFEVWGVMRRVYIWVLVIFFLVVIGSRLCVIKYGRLVGFNIF